MQKRIFSVDEQKWKNSGHDVPFKVTISFLVIAILQGIIAIIADFVLYLNVTDIALVRPTYILMIIMGVYGIVAIIAAVFWSINLNQQLRCFVQMDNKLYAVQHRKDDAFYAIAGGTGARALLDMAGRKREGQAMQFTGTAVAVWNLSKMLANMQNPLWISKTIDEMMQGACGPLDICEIMSPVVISETENKLVIKNGRDKMKILNVYDDELFPLLKGGNTYA